MMWRCPRCRGIRGPQVSSCCGRWRPQDLGRADASTIAALPPVVGGPSPAWPLPGYRKFSRTSIGGDRPFNPPHKRFHCGVDIYCPLGTIVIATEAGTIVAKQGWMSKQGRPERTTKALLLQLDSGPVIVYGALLPDSWLEFGVKVGSRVAQGQPIGRIGTYPKGDNMFHVEGREEGSTSAPPWYNDDPPPPNLLNITPYLVQALKSADAPAGAPYKPGEPYTPPPAARGTRWVQEVLRLLVAPGLEADGKIGPATRAAVRLFQAQQGLEVDGKIGPKTLAALEAMVNGSPLDRILSNLKAALQDVLGG